jgi:hypothetical protein
MTYGGLANPHSRRTPSLWRTGIKGIRMMKRLLGGVAVLSGVTWAVLFGLAVQGRESEAAVHWRTGAFVLAFVAGSLYPVKRHNSDEEETL